MLSNSFKWYNVIWARLSRIRNTWTVIQTHNDGMEERAIKKSSTVTGREYGNNEKELESIAVLYKGFRKWPINVTVLEKRVSTILLFVLCL